MYIVLQRLITLRQNLFKVPNYNIIQHYLCPLGRWLCRNVCRSHSLPSGHYKDKVAEPLLC